MPNWCNTSITFNGDQKEVDRFSSLIEKWTDPSNNNNNGFGNEWLGNIVVNSGLCSYKDIDSSNYRCRGWISYMEISEESLWIQTETAWVPMIKMWVDIVKKYNLDLEIIYEAEEPGGGLYWTNDPVNIDKYYVDIKRDGCTYYDYTEEDILQLAKDKFDIHTNDINECIQKIKEISEANNEFAYIYKWEFIEIDSDDLE